MIRWVSLGLLVAAGVPIAAVQPPKPPIPIPSPPIGEPARPGGPRTIRPAAPVPDAPLRNDQLGDPLPAGAIARFGTVRLRHGAEPATLMFSPDAKVLASISASEEGLRLWDPATGKELARLNLPLSLVCFARDGTIIIAEDARCRIWAPFAGGGIRELPENTLPEHTRALALHPDGKTLAAGTEPPKVVLTDLTTGKQGVELKVPGDQPPVRLAFSPDGRWLAGCGAKSGIWVWDLKTNRRVRTYPSQADSPDFAFSPDSTRLAIASDTLCVYPLDSEEPEEGYSPPEGQVFSPTFSLDGKTVTAIAPDGTVFRTEAATGTVKQTSEPPDMNLRMPLAVAPGGAFVATTDESGGIRIWDPKTRKGPKVERLPALADPGFSADGKTASVLDLNGRVRTFDPTTGKADKVHELPIEEGAQVTYDARTGRAAVLIGAETMTVQVIDAATGKVVAKVPAPAQGVLTVAFHPTDADRMLMVCPGSVAVVSLSAARTLRTINIGQMDDAVRGCYSPDGRLFAITSKPVSIWEIGTGKRRFKIDAVQEPVGVAFSPDGRYVVAWDPTDAVVVFNIRTGTVVRRIQLPGSDGSVMGVAFTPDSKRLATGCRDGLITLWDVATGEPLLNLDRHDGPVNGLAFSGDGRRLLSGSLDGTALVWDLTLRPKPRTAVAVASTEDAIRSLGLSDPTRAQRGMEYLYRNPADTVKLLAGRIRVPAAAPPGRIAGLVADLGSPDFQTRRAAVTELAAIGGEAIAAVRQQIEKSMDPEVRKLAAEVLVKIDGPPTRSDDLRILRAVEVLEGLATADARALLGRWATGPPGNRLTVEAAAAVKRLAPPK